MGNLIKSSSKQGYYEPLLSLLCYNLQMLWVKAHVRLGKRKGFFFSLVELLQCLHYAPSLSFLFLSLSHTQTKQKSIHHRIWAETSAGPHLRCWWWSPSAPSGRTLWLCAPAPTPGRWFPDGGRRTCGRSRSLAWTPCGEGLVRWCRGPKTQCSGSWSEGMEEEKHRWGYSL